METLVIGEGALSLHEVSNVIEESASLGILQTKWRSFATNVGVKDAELPGIDRRINLGTLQLKEAPREVLLIWKATTGSLATLKILCDALVKCELKNIADTLEAKFCQNKTVNLPKFMLQEEMYSLEGLFENHVPEPITQIILSTGLDRATTKPILIIKPEVCSLDISYLFYIPRTLSYRNELDEKIFKADLTKEHIFVVKGNGKPELARASGFKETERSGNQLDKVTVRHILLECDDDFDTICRNNDKDTPVHLIEFKNNSIFHLKSWKGMEAIQTFVKENNVSSREDEVVERFAKINSPSVLSIADSPGMGKTFVLANLSMQIKKKYPNAINCFIVLQELAQTLDSSDSLSAIEAVSIYATTDTLTKLIFQEILSNNKNQFYLFLDGYDEVLQEKLDLVDTFLHQLARFPHIKTIITTRAHLKPRLENITQRLSYEIQPFNESNQIDFLTKYWSCNHGAENGEMLRSFAQKCLLALKVNMTPTEKDIAGVPLQCSILAEVYAEQAKRAAKLKTLPDDVVKMTSFFEMYKSLIQLKFQKIGDSLELQQKYLDAHVYDSIALLFPDWLKRFKVFLSSRDEVEENMIYSIGLIEKSPSSNTPRFQHRTFAENLLAQFVVRNLDKHGTFIKFLYTEIFRTTSRILWFYPDNISSPKEYINRYNVKQPVIAYFVEMHLRDRVQSNEFNHLDFLAALSESEISSWDLCIAANGCCCHSLENCFDLTRMIWTKTNIKRKDYFQDKYFKHLLHLVVEKSENVSLLKKVLNFTKTEFQINVHWHVFDGLYKFDNSLEIRNCTPLHLAVYHGKYNMVIYLLDEYGQDVFFFKHLMHCCLLMSCRNSESIVDDKASIIESLTSINSKWLEEDYESKEPILQDQAHVRLIKYMVQRGVDINTYNGKYENILHTGGDKNTYGDLVRWALRNGFLLINQVDGDGLTPLLRAIKRFGILDEDLLRVFVDAGADINDQDYGKESVLFYAINHSENLEFVKNVLDLGANPSRRNKDRENAAHLVIQNHSGNPQLALELLKMLELHGFKGFNQRNFNWKTPLQIAKERKVSDEDLLNFLKDRTTNCSMQ